MASSFAFQGIPIHPDHNLVFDVEEDALIATATEAMDDLDLDKAPRSLFREFVVDDFEPSPASSPESECSFVFSSPSSTFSSFSSASSDTGEGEDDCGDDSAMLEDTSRCSTPTLEHPYGKANAIPSLKFLPPSPDRALSRHSPYANCRPLSPTRRRQSESPTRSLYAGAMPGSAGGGGGAAMLRSYSTPVLTQRQMNDRTLQRDDLLRNAMTRAASANDAPSSSMMGRSKTCGVHIPFDMTSPSPPLVPLRAPNAPPFAFAAAASTRQEEQPLTYPYNLLNQRKPPAPLLRSNSITDVRNKIGALGLIEETASDELSLSSSSVGGGTMMGRLRPGLSHRPVSYS